MYLTAIRHSSVRFTFGANDVKWLGGTKGVEGGPIPGCRRPVLKPEYPERFKLPRKNGDSTPPSFGMSLN